MTRDEAIAAAEAAREEHQVPPEAELATSELRYIELVRGTRAAPEAIRDARVWVVRFLLPPRFWDLAVDDETGAIVRVERSRGGAR